jgi:hypothetical protein
MIALTTACHISLSWATSIQSMPHPTSVRFILMLHFHPRLFLQSNLLLSGFSTKTLFAPVLSLILTTCFAHHSLLNLITRIIFGKQYGAWSSFLCSLLHYSLTSFFLGPNILLSTLFSKTFSLYYSPNVGDKLSKPYKTTSKIIVLYILIFGLLDSKLEDKSFCTELPQTFPNFNLLLISSWMEFWSVRVVSKSTDILNYLIM